MTEKAYQKRMSELDNSMQKVWNKMAKTTNEFLDSNPDTKIKLGTCSQMDNPIEKIGDSLMLKGAWIYDRLARKYPRDRGSMTKKVRKAIGYTYP